MSKFIVINRSDASLHLMLPAPADSWHHKFAQITLLRGNSVDLVPYTGSIGACKMIAQLYDYKLRGLVEIIEER